MCVRAHREQTGGGESDSSPKKANMSQQQLSSSPSLKPFFLKTPVQVSSPLRQRRHTLPASEFRNLTPQDAISVFEIEREDLFQLVAFIIGTGWDKKRLSQEAMTRHVASTSTVHIHVLSVHHQCRQQGKGSILLWRYLHYLQHLRCMATPRRALLICEDFLVPFYLKAGFKEKGPSAISVSNMHFREMEYLLAGHAYARRNSGC
ncbi:arylalkylamine N-acetyltransferase 2 [Entelurus aequoreus]|uniref:arylalkylamine N-acetyltransferase 2 n=1 Tax=Entelurus aequoreus TaxID=161455 RepID=UPI002B1E6FB3|nr:arylalkylamine N-acetyltransferase 2 [Entelurus aequoreus]